MMKSVVEYSTFGISLNEDIRPNARARLDTGKFCNYNCEFCYYKKQLGERDDLSAIKERIDYIYDYGIVEIDLSGGESSVEPNWFNILDYCRNKGMKHISCLSHGGKFSNKDFLKKSKDHGLKEILFSLHGFTPEVHDSITDRVGSFNRIITAIENSHELGIIVRINCTVYDVNHKTIDHELLSKLKPEQINFILLNYDSDNSDFRKVDYKSLTDSIKVCIDNISDIDINVRYVPFCYMRGYEKHVVNYYQHIYDLRDWNLAIYNQELDASIKYTSKEKLRQAYSHAKERRISAYHKGKECLQCKDLFICDGVEREIKDTPLYPAPGAHITDVMYYK